VTEHGPVLALDDVIGTKSEPWPTAAPPVTSLVDLVQLRGKIRLDTVVRMCETQKISNPETQDAVMTAETAVTTARIRGRGQLTLPTEVREALRVGEGDEVEFTHHDDGTVTVRGLKTIPADQAWFWSPDWQAGERESDEEIASGELSLVHGSAEEMFADLDKRD
jgi:antitoxin PrlF